MFNAKTLIAGLLVASAGVVGWMIAASPSGLLASAALPGVRTEVDTVYYTVTGRTVRDIGKSLDRGARQSGIAPSHAYAEWHVRWHFRTTPARGADGVCTLKRLGVDLAITITMPRWDAPDETPARLTQQWGRYERALRSHEEQHAAHGHAAAEDVQTLLSQMQGACDTVAERANTQARRTVARHAARDRAYDRATNHGHTEGARWPPR